MVHSTISPAPRDNSRRSFSNHPLSRFSESDYTRFYSRVDFNGDCWLWTASRNWAGYGYFTVVVDGRKHKGYAHRASYEFAYGEFDRALYVLHSCDNPSCVNPAHLSLGTQRQNLQEASDKGRTSNQFIKGSKLTWDQVCEIRRRHEIGGENQVTLAGEYGLAVGYINRICRYMVRKYPPKVTPEIEFAIHVAARRTTALGAIADLFGSHKSTVNRSLTRKPRPLGTAEERVAYDAA